MSVGKKYRGKYAACIEKYITERLSGRDDIDYKRIFITHSPSDKEIIDIAHKTVKKLGNSRRYSKPRQAVRYAVTADPIRWVYCL